MSAFANSCEFRPEPQDAFSEAEYLAWVESAEPRCIDDTPEEDADYLDPTGGYEFDPDDAVDDDWDGDFYGAEQEFFEYPE